MSKRETKNILNRTGAFSLSQKRHLRGVIDNIYADGATDQMSGVGSGFTGTGTIAKQSVTEADGIITTQILIDLTGLHSSTTLIDIIGGEGAANCHFGYIDPDVNGTILSGWIQCLETPAGGITDIDIYSADEATGTEDTTIGGLTETVLHANAGAWSAALSTNTAFSAALPPANEYLYLAVGVAGTVGTYTAGQFLITLIGYRA